LADLDADGTKDLITGCYEGGPYLLPGREGGGFLEPRSVLDKEGNILRVGRYWERHTNEWSEVPTSKFKQCLGISACPVDWDADGDLDLLLGTHGGRVFLRLNEGSRSKPAFATENIPVQAAGKFLEVPVSGTNRCRGRGHPGQHAMPVAADWDGDGLWDLVTGSAAGAVYWYRNTGKKGAPVFAAPQTLVGAADRGLGERTQVAVADFDADGRPDLLVGDYRPAAKAKEGRPKHHGWVWLLRRKPVPQRAGAREKTPGPPK
jgi:hypothetical protein